MADANIDIQSRIADIALILIYKIQHINSYSEYNLIITNEIYI